MATNPLTISARFITSSPEYTKCPAPVMPEYAFIGRSNVGKSSLINMLTGVKMLAKTSSTPGKTQLINHFLINESWYIVDLPGYGYARTAKIKREQWPNVIEKYLLYRTSLMTTFLLIDSRLELQENDRKVINWFGENGLPFVIVLTKTDKLTPNQVNANQVRLSNKLKEEWEELPVFILTSSKNLEGRAEILQYIDQTNLLFQVP
ncbi:MAG: ribosome biogenesis GTP-binding protein YihA/YsxC [Bacteroidales bacterium]|jgi:GTP-binding protein|nr:ribosome biogenesis GTP-binding protein YihA/YsxC [Bacteroidales bacterium]